MKISLLSLAPPPNSLFSLSPLSLCNQTQKTPTNTVFLQISLRTFPFSSYIKTRTKKKKIPFIIIMNSTPTNPSSSQIHQIYYNYHHPHRHQQQEQQEDDKEHMFEKPLTPSDVGKLNRLVIPKQHAEKYFPLSSGTTESAEKGFLLSFEDELGKPWRFRYSYWTSSQSYVLTKGWSRFVKEKRLDAGDVVTFERLGVGARRFDAVNNNNNRFFIRCRRRSGTQAHDSGVSLSSSTQPVVPDANVLWAQAFYHTHHHHHHHPYSTHTPLDRDFSSSSYQSQQPCFSGDAGEPVGGVEGNAMKTQGNWKRVRLFGVNLDCQMEGSGPQGPECSGLSGQGPAHFVFSQPHGPTHYNHMPRDVMMSESVSPERGGDVSI